MNLRILSFVMALSGLSGCSTAPTTLTPIEVQVPVPVRCKVEFPTKPVSIGEDNPTDGVYNRGKRILSECVDYRLYARSLEALLRACADEN